MMCEVRFPALSRDDPETVGVVSTWFVRDGDSVRTDDVVAEVQVDKVAAEVLATGAGRIHLLAPEDAEVRQGELIATID